MVARENGEDRDDHSSDTEKDLRNIKEGESDYEPARDSLSSQGDTPLNEEKAKRASRVPKKLIKKDPANGRPRISRGNATHQKHVKLEYKSNNEKKSQKPIKSLVLPRNSINKKSDVVDDPSKSSSEVSEESDDKPIEEGKEIQFLNEAPHCNQSFGTDDETVEIEEDDRAGLKQKIEEMESRIEKLEEELREAAALEISLYSVIPEHGSSAHKVHTPARRLSRLYLHACKYWTQDKKATVARSTVSGLVLVAKSCGNDVSRLTFWLSNTIVLREIISQTFGHLSLAAQYFKSNGKSMAVSRENYGAKQAKNVGFFHLVDDWKDTSTFTNALGRIEGWLFSRVVESVWWQTLTPHMQSPTDEMNAMKVTLKLLGPALGDQQQGSFSIDLWKRAFQDSFTRLCPVRAGGHECGCLPVLARMVMEQCVSRLDIAMFNAILRESANEIPTDPVSDPIVDSKVLPIPAGNLSFGSGAQLKNAIGNWSRLLMDSFGNGIDEIGNDKMVAVEDNWREENKSYFPLLNELSDLLMLPKDMLLERPIRREVCPSIGLPLIMRILCNFTPDELCPDPVPGMVLEELNTESILERKISEDLISSFPCVAPPVVYSPPLAVDIAEKVADFSGKPELDRRASMIQRKGYTSDEDLDLLDSPLDSMLDKVPPFSPAKNSSYKENHEAATIRYKLLREVWFA